MQEGSSFGAYASVRDLILGFDNRVLQAALSVDEGVIKELRSGGKQAMIVHGVAKAKTKELWEVHYRIMRAFLGRMKNGMIDMNKKDDKDKAYNILTADHDVENCNGWSLVVTSKQLDALKDSDFGIFMVNLTKGSMMGPHWNPTTAEIGVVLRGRGMVHVVCPGTLNETECKNSRFRVEEGDVFVVPRYHPMAQMSFSNGSFVFMGFTTTTKKNHPQYLVGTASVLQVLDKRVLAASFGVSNMTMDEVLKAQREAIILECTSCAEEEERLMEEEIQRAKEEEAKRREEKEAREKEEEEAKRREEEKRRQEEEEEARRQEEEERREQEEARKREEEEARRQEEEAAKRREEQEEEDARKHKEEEEARRQEEEAAKRQEEQEKEEARKQKEEAEAKRQEEEAARRREEQEEEEARKQQEEEEAARRRQQEEEARKQQEEEAARRQEEEAARRQEEQEEEARKRQQEEEARRRQEEEGRRRHEEEGAGRGGGGRGQGEGEAASREEEEMARREREAEAEAEAAARGRGGQGNESYEEW